MLLIVSDSFEASSQNPTMAEKASRTETWTRLLFGLIPEHELQTAFDQAFRAHASTFPVNAYEIKQSYEQIKQDRIRSFDEIEFKRMLESQKQGDG